MNVLANSGTLSLGKSGASATFNGIAPVDEVNILVNTGVVNIDYTTDGNTTSGQVNVGGAFQNLASVHGTINLVGKYALAIDDRGHIGTPPSWLITTTQTKIGDLTFNYESGNQYQAFWKTGSAVKYRDTLAFAFSSLNLNGLSACQYYPFN